LINQPELYFDPDLTKIPIISSLASDDEEKASFMAKIEVAYTRSKDVITEYHKKMLELKDLYDDINSTRLKFAWCKRLGHIILRDYSIMIGGTEIDKQYGEWLSIWHQLTGNMNMEKVYNKMIGNVSSMTSFDRKTKDAYTLMIPLQFWFNRYNGLALPLVALEYHDVTLTLTTRDINECCYIEEGELIYIKETDITSTDNGLYLDELDETNGFDLDMTLVMDYIYLDTNERRRFAQSSHEYLIEQIQVNEFEGITTDKFSVKLSFNHPSKFIVWTMRKKSNLQNDDGGNECRWDDFSSGTTGFGNPIKNARISFNGYERVIKIDNTFFNYLQPRQHFSNTPSDGVNLYSFSIHPEEYQPFGQSNMSRLKRVTLNIELDPDYVSDDMILTAYSMNYNILRFVQGMSGCAYTY